MNKHGYSHVRKVNDGRPKPYFGRVSFAGIERQTKGCATAAEAHQAAQQLRSEHELGLSKRMNQLDNRAKKSSNIKGKNQGW